MNNETTEIKWSYEPPDYLEVSYKAAHAGALIELTAGCATAILDVAHDQIPSDLLASIEAVVKTILQTHMLETGRTCHISKPKVIQHQADGKKTTAISVGASVMIASGQPVDLLTTTPDGTVVKDTRAERIASREALVKLFAEAVEKEPLVGRLLASYQSAIDDSQNAFVHLYEIRDALVWHYGDAEAVRTQLDLSKKDWGLLGELANARPVQESRHRGKYMGRLRQATHDELTEARKIARTIVEAFARSI